MAISISERRRSISMRPTRLVAVLSGLCACAPLPQHYVNSVHPEYGLPAYMSDLGQCRDLSSTQVVSTLTDYYYDYPSRSAVAVDHVKANGCMTRRGWEPAPTSVSRF